ncbi:hypothetical protein DAPPUDRAFT_119056 [Daphnia pulex]|uniref:Uncharacterized protein n=1 Tax=Daphnia pulex TaxID=6669 RepID=E9HXB2_DAPPU|nr:hypothetical protein DAPPUDRAFT_119056 [Daphnia pulex]|eukprot:EFX63615.1 hypothetical protein DAPPUDRAFT_119056 [Daphnia pulex]
MFSGTGTNLGLTSVFIQNPSPLQRLNLHHSWSDGNIYFDPGDLTDSSRRTSVTASIGEMGYLTCTSTSTQAVIRINRSVAQTKTLAPITINSYTGVLMTLNQEQQTAVDGILDAYKHFLQASSYGGTGKTYTALEIINAILAYRATQNRKFTKIVFVAPTNDAKNELQKSIESGGQLKGYCETKFRTVASLLGKQLDLDDRGKVIFTGEKDNGFKNVSILVVDEASMVSKKDTEEIIENCKYAGIFVIALGDAYQHFPVGEKSSELIERCTISFQLLRNMRQAGSGNPIAEISARCREAVINKEQNFDYRKYFNKNKTLPDKTGHYFSWDLEDDDAEVNPKKMLHSAWAKAYELDDPNRVKVICFTNKKVAATNQLIRSMLFGEKAGFDFLPGEYLVAKAPVTEEIMLPDGTKIGANVIDNEQRQYTRLKYFHLKNTNVI